MTDALREANDMLVHAVQAGNMSPCMKSRRGVVIWNTPNETIHGGWNAPPEGWTCDGTEACRLSCSKICVHAEQAAILQAQSASQSVYGSEMLHVKVVDGEAVPSGGPSCWQCSRVMVDAGITGMWLLHKDGLRRYEIHEFHSLTLEACELYGGVRTGVPKGKVVAGDT